MMTTRAIAKSVTNGGNRTPPTTSSAKVCAIRLPPERSRRRYPDQGSCLSGSGTQRHLPRSSLSAEPSHATGAQSRAGWLYLACRSPRVLRPPVVPMAIGELHQLRIAKAEYCRLVEAREHFR